MNTTIVRYILMDSNSGYIWGDTGVIGSDSPTTLRDPRMAAQMVDQDARCFNRHYFEHSPRARLDESHYLVYEVDADFPEVSDGTNQSLIDELDKRGNLVAKVSWVDEDAP